MIYYCKYYATEIIAVLADPACPMGCPKSFLFLKSIISKIISTARNYRRSNRSLISGNSYWTIYYVSPLSPSAPVASSSSTASDSISSRKYYATEIIAVLADTACQIVSFF